MSDSNLTGYIYHLTDNGVVVYVGKSNSSQNAFKRVEQHAKNGKVFDAVSVKPVHGVDLDEAETDEIIRLNPRYNKILSSSAKYTKRQAALDKIAAAIKNKSGVSKLNGSVYYDTAFIEEVLCLIDGM